MGYWKWVGDIIKDGCHFLFYDMKPLIYFIVFSFVCYLIAYLLFEVIFDIYATKNPILMLSMFFIWLLLSIIIVTYGFYKDEVK